MAKARISRSDNSLKFFMVLRASQFIAGWKARSLRPVRYPGKRAARRILDSCIHRLILKKFLNGMMRAISPLRMRVTRHSAGFASGRTGGEEIQHDYLSFDKSRSLS